MDDIYKYLKPVLGDTADLLALERELRIRKGEILLDVPSKENADGEIKIGKIHQGNYDFGISKDELTNHLLIAGRTGSGKTNTSFQLIKSLMEQKIPFIIFDWKKTHRNLLTVFPSIKIFTIGRDVTPFYFNPLIPPPKTNAKNWALSLSQIWEASSLLGPGASHLLLKSFDELYEKFGIYNNPETETYPAMHDLLSYLESLSIKKFRESMWLSSSKRAIQGICFGDFGNALNVRKKSSINYLENSLNQNIILELETLTHSQKIFFIYSLLLWLHHYNLNTSDRGKLKRVLILEECHHLLSKHFHKSTLTEDVLENLVREFREFGISFMMLFQTISNIPNTVLSNIHTIICHNLVHEQDINAMSGILLLDQKEKKYVSQLKVGQAIVKLQSRYTKPFLVNVPYFNIIRDRIISDSEIKKQNDSNFPDFQMKKAKAQQESSNSTFFHGHIYKEELTFLLSLINKPFLPISLRYMELGFHTRKGNDIKNKLIKFGFIKKVPIQVSDNKLIMLFELTEKSKNVLKNRGYSVSNFESKGGLEHAFWINFIMNVLKEKDYLVRLEYKGIDIVALKDKKIIAIEVETGNSYFDKNIEKCLNLGFKKVFSAATNMETCIKIKHYVDSLKLENKVEIILARNYEVL